MMTLLKIGLINLLVFSYLSVFAEVLFVPNPDDDKRYETKFFFTRDEIFLMQEILNSKNKGFSNTINSKNIKRFGKTISENFDNKKFRDIDKSLHKQSLSCDQSSRTCTLKMSKKDNRLKGFTPIVVFSTEDVEALVNLSTSLLENSIKSKVEANKKEGMDYLWHKLTNSSSIPPAKEKIAGVDFECTITGDPGGGIWQSCHGTMNLGHKDIARSFAIQDELEAVGIAPSSLKDDSLGHLPEDGRNETKPKGVSDNEKPKVINSAAEKN